ncbi:uncharacterized protein PSFLO_06540 [Pseudozyma flocculosa]|uniref:Uncharacterized protein n=1 Tax=Pseudozyma flocculosa TaxID=84751 RepID=A0A5C3F9D6_9BASI|nr:uncharacterized protein PSFLO_06540 [Pseudozyma flocculosa]
MAYRHTRRGSGYDEEQRVSRGSAATSVRFRRPGLARQDSRDTTTTARPGGSGGGDSDDDGGCSGGGGGGGHSASPRNIAVAIGVLRPSSQALCRPPSRRSQPSWFQVVHRPSSSLGFRAGAGGDAAAVDGLSQLPSIDAAVPSILGLAEAAGGDKLPCLLAWVWGPIRRLRHLDPCLCLPGLRASTASPPRRCQPAALNFSVLAERHQTRARAPGCSPAQKCSAASLGGEGGFHAAVSQARRPRSPPPLLSFREADRPDKQLVSRARQRLQRAGDGATLAGDRSESAYPDQVPAAWCTSMDRWHSLRNTQTVGELSRITCWRRLACLRRCTSLTDVVGWHPDGRPSLPFCQGSVFDRPGKRRQENLAPAANSNRANAKQQDVTMPSPWPPALPALLPQLRCRPGRPTGVEALLGIEIGPSLRIRPWFRHQTALASSRSPGSCFDRVALASASYVVSERGATSAKTSATGEQWAKLLGAIVAPSSSLSSGIAATVRGLSEKEIEGRKTCLAGLLSYQPVPAAKDSWTATSEDLDPRKPEVGIGILAVSRGTLATERQPSEDLASAPCGTAHSLREMPSVPGAGRRGLTKR